MPVNTPENVSCRKHGDWLWVGWSYIPVEGDDLAGFKVKYGDGSLPEGWLIPPAVDVQTRGGDDGSPKEFFSLVLRISDGFILDWETFETYPLGPVGVMDDNVGGLWDGAASTGDVYYRTIAADDFESYPIGTVGVLNGGFGWAGAATTGTTI